MPFHKKLVLIGLLAATVAVAGEADSKQQQKQTKKPHANQGTAQHEKLIRAPGGVLVPPRAPPGRSPGFMDDGAHKSGEKP